MSEPPPNLEHRNEENSCLSLQQRVEKQKGSAGRGELGKTLTGLELVVFPNNVDTFLSPSLSQAVNKVYSANWASEINWW